MVETEVFINPTVREVHFEIRFPHIFSIENKIGDFQMKIFEKFPESKYLVRSSVIFVDKGPESTLDKIDERPSTKIWNFSYGDEYELSIHTNKIGLLSKVHKSYDLGEGETFRDIIEYVIKGFFELIPITKVSRIGLRYIDVGPLPEKNNDKLVEYYNTTYPISRFDLETTESYEFVLRSKVEDIDYTYRESLIKEEEDYKIKLDYDTYIFNINVSDIITTTNRLHSIHKREWINSFKEPMFSFMRGELNG